MGPGSGILGPPWGKTAELEEKAQRAFCKKAQAQRCGGQEDRVHRPQKRGQQAGGRGERGHQMV